MLRSMFTGISGLKNHQARMDVVANNIANVNTTGFKRGRVNFQDILSQTVRGASQATATVGGTNPTQIGLGMTVASIDTLFTQGNLQLTGVNTDLAIQGDGMFVLRDSAGSSLYSRAGTFVVDSEGTLVNVANGYCVQGWQANAGVINTNNPIAAIAIPVGDTIPPNQTSSLTFRGNLKATTNGTINLSSSTQVYTDSVAGNASAAWTITPTGNINEYTVTGTLANPAQWNNGGALVGNTLTYTITTNAAGAVIADTAPAATYDIDYDGVLGGNTATVNLINTGDTLDGTLDDITVVGPDTVVPAIGTTYTAPIVHTTSIDVYDSLGNPHTITINFDHDAVNNNEWNWTASGTGVTAGNGTLVFGTNGTLNATLTDAAPSTAISINVAPAASPLTIGLTSANFTGTTQYAGNNSLVAASQDGYRSGTLSSFTIGDSGIISGVYTNGLTQNLAQAALASFVNYGGLQKVADNMYVESVNSGNAQIGEAKTDSRGSISAGTLEMSNVDIAQEFVDMITAQRGFQVNSRSITTSDEILQEVIQMKR